MVSKIMLFVLLISYSTGVVEFGSDNEVVIPHDSLRYFQYSHDAQQYG